MIGLSMLVVPAVMLAVGGALAVREEKALRKRLSEIRRKIRELESSQSKETP